MTISDTNYLVLFSILAAVGLFHVKKLFYLKGQAGKLLFLATIPITVIDKHSLYLNMMFAFALPVCSSFFHLILHFIHFILDDTQLAGKDIRNIFDSLCTLFICCILVCIFLAPRKTEFRTKGILNSMGGIIYYSKIKSYLCKSRDDITFIAIEINKDNFFYFDVKISDLDYISSILSELVPS